MDLLLPITALIMKKEEMIIINKKFFLAKIHQDGNIIALQV